MFTILYWNVLGIFLALVSLTEPLDEPECTPCFNQKKNITNETCKSFQNNNFKNSIKSHFQSSYYHFIHKEVDTSYNPLIIVNVVFSRKLWRSSKTKKFGQQCVFNIAVQSLEDAIQRECERVLL